MPGRFLRTKATAFRNRQNLRHKKGTHWVSSLFLLRPAWAAMRSVPLCSKPLFAKTISARFCPANARIRPTAMRPTLKQSHARIDLLGNRPCETAFCAVCSRMGKSSLPVLCLPQSRIPFITGCFPCCAFAIPADKAVFYRLCPLAGRLPSALAILYSALARRFTG